MSKVISVGEAGRPMALIGEARRAFAGRASPTVSHPRFLEFVADGVSKGRAVAWLAHRAGIPLGQVLAIGDALNDIEMIARRGARGGDGDRACRRSSSRPATSRTPVEQDGAAALIEALVLAPEPEARRNAGAGCEDAARARHDGAAGGGAGRAGAARPGTAA